VLGALTLAGDLDEALSAVAERLRRSTVIVGSGSGHGSGLVTGSHGTIVTNAHVATRRSASIRSHDGRESRAEVIARSERLDLAALRTDTRGLAPAPFRDSRSLRPGEIVVAVGNPLDLVGALTVGVVHSADRRGRRVYADVRLLPGNSGGPLADADGNVVGINAMVAYGLAVAVSGESVRRFLAAPDAQPQLGVTTRPVVASVMGEKREGLLVIDTAERSGAAVSGVLTGDVIIGVDGRLFDAAGELGDLVDSSAVGDHLRLDILRAGRVIGIDTLVTDASFRPAAA
jgi:serine protease Do